MKTLIYKFRLTPSDHQTQTIRANARRLRRVWNALVGAMKKAEHECQHGRQATIVKRLEDIMAAKALSGPGKSTAIKQIVQEQGLSMDAAKRVYARKSLSNQSGALVGDTIVRKNGTKARRASIRTLAVRYAAETIGTQIERFGVESQAFWGVVTKFKNATDDYPSNKRGAPRFKRIGDNVAMQCQVPRDPLNGHGRVDLSRIFGDGCESVAFVQHRDLPDGAVVKQVAVIDQPVGLFVALFVNVPDEVAQKAFPACAGAVAGIDPGRKTAVALSAPDGSRQSTVQPPLLRDKRFMRKMARLARKADRQRRKTNPDNYDAKGSPKRRVKWKTTRNMLRVRAEAARLSQRLIDVRTEHYRLKAREVLSTFDHVGVGTWRPNGSAIGVGKAKRAQVRKDVDNALGQFVGILKDYANRSATPKAVIDVNEAGTTRQCVSCDAPTGPSGVEKLNLREWTCANCGTHHQRDFASAQAIAKRTAKIVTDTHSANGGSSNGAEIKPARHPSRSGKRSGAAETSSKVPVEQEAKIARSRVSKVGARASATVTNQCAVGARASAATANDGLARVLTLEPLVNACKGDHRSHSCSDESEAQELTTIASQ